jgi:hypothetical protein
MSASNRGRHRLAIVVLDPQQHPAAEHAGDPPDYRRVQHMAQVQPAGRRRREPRQRIGRQARGQRPQVHIRQAEQNRDSLSPL